MSSRVFRRGFWKMCIFQGPPEQSVGAGICASSRVFQGAGRCTSSRVFWKMYIFQGRLSGSSRGGGALEDIHLPGSSRGVEEGVHLPESSSGCIGRCTPPPHIH